MSDCEKKLTNTKQGPAGRVIYIKGYGIRKGAKLTRSTSAYALPLFLPRPKNSGQKASIQGQNNLSKVGSWEQFYNKPQNSLPALF